MIDWKKEYWAFLKILKYKIYTLDKPGYSWGKFCVRGGADCTALPWGNSLYWKLKLKREEEKLIIRLKYLNKYSKR